MKFKKGFFVAVAALALLVTLLPVSQAEAAGRGFRGGGFRVVSILALRSIHTLITTPIGGSRTIPSFPMRVT